MSVQNVFDRISWNFDTCFIDLILVFMQKKVYLHEFIFFLERVQYLGKMP